MMAVTRIVILLCAVLIFLDSCTSIRWRILRNDKFTDKMISKTLADSGNVFYIRSTSSTFSTIWTYVGGNLELYRLANGKVRQKEVYLREPITKYVIPSVEELYNEMNECGYALDGDILGFKLRVDGRIIAFDIPVEIECFIDIDYESLFLAKLVEDVKFHQIWDVIYE